MIAAKLFVHIFVRIEVEEAVSGMEDTKAAIAWKVLMAQENGFTSFWIQFQCKQAIFDDGSADAVGEKRMEVFACLGDVAQGLVV
jgi:hypothetical protein